MSFIALSEMPPFFFFENKTKQNKNPLRNPNSWSSLYTIDTFSYPSWASHLLSGWILAADIGYLEPASVCTLGNEISIWYEVCIYFYSSVSLFYSLSPSSDSLTQSIFGEERNAVRFIADFSLPHLWYMFNKIFYFLGSWVFLPSIYIPIRQQTLHWSRRAHLSIFS